MFGSMDSGSSILYVLIACEESQAECIAFRQLGHVAYSCDLQPCRRGGVPSWHIVGDVRPFLHGVTQFVTQNGNLSQVPRWDLIIAHPPCTYLCKVGAQWLYKNPDGYRCVHGAPTPVNLARWEKMMAGREFFLECLGAQADYVAVENPLPMRCAQLPPATAYACPSWFGGRYSKKTLYWLKNLPPLMAGVVEPLPRCWVHCSRGKYRSRTFPGLAQAIARQWSAYILDDMRLKGKGVQLP